MGARRADSPRPLWSARAEPFLGSVQPGWPTARGHQYPQRGAQLKRPPLARVDPPLTSRAGQGAAQDDCASKDGRHGVNGSAARSRHDLGRRAVGGRERSVDGFPLLIERHRRSTPPELSWTPGRFSASGRVFVPAERNSFRVGKVQHQRLGRGTFSDPKSYA